MNIKSSHPINLELSEDMEFDKKYYRKEKIV